MCRLYGESQVGGQSGQDDNCASSDGRIYSHTSAAGGAGPTAPQTPDYIAATRETYGGPLEMGEDLMTINVGEAVTVERSGKN